MKRYTWILLVLSACASGGGGGGGGDDDDDDDGNDTDGGGTTGDGDGDGDGGGGGGNGTSWLVLGEDGHPRLSVEPGGDLYVAGTFRETVTIGGTSLTSAGASDIFVARFAPDGQARWVRRFGGTDSDHLTGLDAGADGVAVTGSFRGAIDFGGGTLVANNGAGWNYQDLFVARLDGDGDHRWSADTLAHGNGRAVALDDTSDRVLVAGDISGLTDAYCTQYRTCGAAILYQPNGQPLWTRTLRPAGTAITATFDHVVFAPGGLAVVMGEGSTAVVAAPPYTYGASTPYTGTNGGSDVIVSAFLATTGEHRWSRRYGGGGGDRPYGLAVDGDRLLLTMSSSWTSLVVQQMEPLGDVDIILARIGFDGSGAWSRRYGGFDVTSPVALHAGFDGRRLLAGTFTRRATFGAITLEAQGADDAFVLDVGGAPDVEPAIILAPSGAGSERIEDLRWLGDRLIVSGRVTEPTRIMGVDVPAKSSFVIAGAP
jgi:hypothetical protein